MSKPRSFDWDEARRLHDAGLTYAEIGRRFGVTSTAIIYACRPSSYEPSLRRARDWQRQGRCSDCGAQTTRTRLDRSTRCVTCAARLRAKLDGDNAYCPTCSAWKPVSEFSPSSKRKGRGVHGECRTCDTARRRANRAKNRDRDNAVSREYKRRVRQAVAA